MANMKNHANVCVAKKFLQNYMSKTVSGIEYCRFDN